MNKPFLKFSAFVLAGAMLVACGSDDDASKSNEEETGAEFPTEYADLSVEENKSNLEDNGIEFANSVEALKNSSGIETSIAFSNFASDGDLAIGRKSSLPIFDLVNNLRDFGRSNKPLDKTLAGMRTSEDIESIQTEFNNVAGTYTYNSQEQVWDSVPGGGSGKIVFKFPSKENGTTNNAEYTIYDYKGVNVSNSAVSEDYAGEYPAGLKIDLTIDGQKKLEYTFTAGYNSKGEPTSLTISVKVDAFVLAYEVSNDGTKASVKYSLKENDKNLYVLGADAEGNFDTDNIENSSGGDDVINKGTIYFQVLNIKFSGEIDVEALMTDIAAIPDEGGDAEEATAWNENSTMVVFYADSKTKIAEGEVVAVTKTRTVTDWWSEECGWNENDQWECPTYDEEFTAKEVQLVFADESRMSMDMFVKTGFDELTEKLKDLAGE
ncbi:hypothetical protein KK062_11810 [Fulvivirgaceae bacterium PWU5]|uniref:Uncharacterized protein n=1 Tax=Dawidia cretensis TaxID=2782350 RepID=A0AAP2GUH0_9BACT|nr:hypothetical protein [Dawidia cretensis]MBT1708915.1 hypothetical protein [Dawidia cretensis]